MRHVQRCQRRNGPSQGQVNEINRLFIAGGTVLPPVPFCAARKFRYDVGLPISTILLHAARALTPTTEIPDAGILIHAGGIEAPGPPRHMTRRAAAEPGSASGRT